MQGWYLPNLKSSCINCKYLYEVATNKCFRIKKSDIRQGTLLKSVKEKELCEILQAILQNAILGFQYKTSPNKEWLINVIYSLQNTHEIFSKPQVAQQSIQLPEADFQQFFWRTEQQVMELKIKKKERKLKRIQKINKREGERSLDSKKDVTRAVAKGYRNRIKVEQHGRKLLDYLPEKSPDITVKLTSIR